jgi:Icc-related predicted phosphoesterase
MTRCFFISDLHGSTDRYNKLFSLIKNEHPDAVFIGGDILPSGLKSIISDSDSDDYLKKVIISGFSNLKDDMKEDYPEIFIILGNDDGKYDEPKIIKAESQGLWHYIHNKKVILKNKVVYGYSYIPPSPFLMKDWEKYDVSRYTEAGCISPEDGKRTFHIEPNIVKYSTIKKDLDELFGDKDLSNTIILFHSPPYKTNLDRAALDGKFFDSAPLDVFVGSIAIKDLIEERQPYITLHGHIHESAGITGSWKDKIGKTILFTGAHDGKELAVVKFDLEKPEKAVRLLL